MRITIVTLLALCLCQHPATAQKLDVAAVTAELSDQIAKLQTAEVVQATTSDENVYLSVRVVDQSGREKTWDHYLSALELKQWAEDPKVPILKAYATAARLLDEETAAKAAPEPVKDLPNPDKKELVDHVAAIQAAIEAVVEKDSKLTKEEKAAQVEELKKKLP